MNSKFKYLLTSLQNRVVKNKRELPGAAVCIAFKSKYPKAAFVRWKQIDVFKWQVNFNSKGKKFTSLYDSEGNWLETITLVPLEFIPKKVQQNFKGKFNREGLHQIYQIQTPHHVIFEMQWGNGIYTLKLIYDVAGKILGKLIL